MQILKLYTDNYSKEGYSVDFLYLEKIYNTRRYFKKYLQKIFKNFTFENSEKREEKFKEFWKKFLKEDVAKYKDYEGYLYIEKRNNKEYYLKIEIEKYGRHYLDIMADIRKQLNE